MYDKLGLKRYREADISSMTKEKMIVMLYEKIISDLEIAIEAVGRNDRLKMTDRVNHAQRIVSELRSALDHSIGGEISLNLESIYDYMFHECLQFLLDQDPRHAQDCIDVLQPLLDAWRQIPTGTAERSAQNLSRGLPVPEVGPEPASHEGDQDQSGQSSSDQVGPADSNAPNQGLLSVSA